MKLGDKGLVALLIVATGLCTFVGLSLLRGAPLNDRNLNANTQPFPPQEDLLVKVEFDANICVGTNYLTTKGKIAHRGGTTDYSEKIIGSAELENVVKTLPLVTSANGVKKFEFTEKDDRPSYDDTIITVFVYPNDKYEFPFSGRPGELFNETTFVQDLLNATYFTRLCWA
jgi:hypothetical protein